MQKNCISNFHREDDKITYDTSAETLRTCETKVENIPESDLEFVTDTDANLIDKTFALEIRLTPFLNSAKISLKNLIRNSFPDLKSLIVSNSQLTKKTVNVEKIIITDNIIESFENIEYFTGNGVDFTSMFRSKMFNDLKVLTFYYSKIPEIRTLIENQKNLVTFMCYVCYLNEISEDTFESNIKMKSLLLVRNNIETIPENLFKTLENLVNLNLERNKIKKIPSNLLNFNPNLEHVNFAYNMIEVLEKNLFIKNIKLSAIKFNGNPLKKIFVDFHLIKNLKYLDFSGENICVPENIHLYVTRVSAAQNKEIKKHCQ